MVAPSPAWPPPLDAVTVDQLRARHDELLAAWRERVFASFPGDAVGFLRSEGDAFRNPLGARIRQSTAGVLDGLTAGVPAEAHAAALDDFIRARALQGHGAAATLRFIFELKAIVRDAIGGVLTPRQREAIDTYVDAIALVGVDVYARCRDEVSAIRVRAEQRRVATLIRRFGPVDEGEAMVMEVQP